MNEAREHLHAIIDQLPDATLDHARIALEYCRDPEKHRMNIEQARQRVLGKSQARLRDFAERTGRGYISGIGIGGGHTFADGDHHSSMVAFEDGKNATYHLYVHRGIAFEIVETLELSPDGKQLIRRERITAPDGSEHTLVAELPTMPSHDSGTIR